MNRRYPRYPDDADYQTNAPSYYEDLARKQKLIEMLAKKIWEYEETLDLTLEQITNRLECYIEENDQLMADRLEQWDLNLEKFPENVELLLQEWLSDGTLDHIINDTIFNWKADKTYVDSEIERLDRKDEKLTTEQEQTEIDLQGRGINILNPPKPYLPVELNGVNDSERFQLLINDFDYLIIPSGSVVYLTKPLNIAANKKIVGINSPKIILNNTNGISILERKNLQITGVYFEGVTGKEIGINGQFGGELIDCDFINLDIGVNNLFGFITDYVDCRFKQCSLGLNSEESNSVVVNNCHFSENIHHIEFGENGVPIHIKDTVFNISTNTLKGVSGRGMMNFDTCYFESFGGNSPDTVFIDWRITPHGKPLINIRNCHINGGGVTKHAIKMDKENSTLAPHVKGEIAFNNFHNFLEEEIVFGTNNNFSSPHIHSNQRDITVLNQHLYFPYKPLTMVFRTTDLLPSGTTNVVFDDIYKDNVDSFKIEEHPYRYTVRKTGIYRITCSMTYENLETVKKNTRLIVSLNGGSKQFNAYGSVTTDIQELKVDITISLKRNDMIDIQTVANDTRAYNGMLGIEWISDDGVS